MCGSTACSPSSVVVSSSGNADPGNGGMKSGIKGGLESGTHLERLVRVRLLLLLDASSRSSSSDASGYAYSSCSSSVSGMTKLTGTARHSYTSLSLLFRVRPFQMRSFTRDPGSAPFHDGNTGRFEGLEGPALGPPVPVVVALVSSRPASSGAFPVMIASPPFSCNHSFKSERSIPTSESP